MYTYGARTRTHTHTHIHIHICICTFTCMPTYTHSTNCQVCCICECIQTLTYTFISHILRFVLYVFVYTHIFTYTDMHTHTNMSVFSRLICVLYVYISQIHSDSHFYIAPIYAQPQASMSYAHLCSVICIFLLLFLN